MTTDAQRALTQFVSLGAYGLFTSALFRARTPPAELRRRFERFGAVPRSALLAKFPRLEFTDHALGGFTMESVRATERPARIVLHFHGGAFVFGSPASYRNRAMRLAHRLSAEVFVPDYRLAPEHRYPAALDDAVVAYQYVRALRPGAQVVVSGDSAGGGLALSLMLRLRELGAPLPAGAVLLSPWTDLAVTGRSVDDNRRTDRWFSREHLEVWSRYYAGTTDPRTPLLSPVFADLGGLPPALVVVGGDELLLSDAVRVRQNGERDGVDVRLVVGEGMQHDYPLTLPWLPESRAAFAAMARFLEGLGG